MTRTIYTGHTITANVSNEAQLGAMFQIWCRQFGISDLQSLAIWLMGTNRWDLCFDTHNDLIRHATAGIGNLPDEKLIELK